MYYFMQIVNVFVWRWTVACSSQNKIYVMLCYVMLCYVMLCYVMLCIQCDLRILNGRMLGDSLGQYTSHQPAGSWMIDCFIVSEPILNLIPCFTVYNYLVDLSDITSNTNIFLQTIYFKVKLNPLSSKFILNDDSPFMFEQALISTVIQNSIRKFMKKVYRNTDSLDAATDFSDIIKSAATMSLKNTNIWNISKSQ